MITFGVLLLVIGGAGWAIEHYWPGSLSEWFNKIKGEK